MAEGYQTFHYDMDNFQAAALFLFFIAVVDTSSVLRVKDALATREQSERLLSRRKLRQLSPLKEGGMTSPENTEEAAHNGTYQINVFFEFVVPGVLLNGIGLLGLLGNTLSIAVLSRPQMKSSINCILIGLASFDAVLILTSILMFGLPAVHTYSPDWFHTYFYDVFPYITPVVYPVGMIAQTGSVYLTICVTIERYVAVCLPLKARYLCTYFRAKIYVACIGLLSLLYNIPRFWEVTWQTTFYPELEVNITNVASTELRENPTYINIYITWLYLVVMYIVPFSCLALFNLMIYREVRRANSERASLTRLQQKEIGLATMLMVVVVVFFVCNILALVVNILEVLDINIMALNNTSNLLVTFNSSVNLVIYCIFGEKFKRIFFHMFCPSCLTKEPRTFVTRYPQTTMAGGALNHENRQPLLEKKATHGGIEDTYHDMKGQSKWEEALPMGRLNGELESLSQLKRMQQRQKQPQQPQQPLRDITVTVCTHHATDADEQRFRTPADGSSSHGSHSSFPFIDNN